jgi:peptide/nickel transport system substrate-binding protein
LDEQSNYWLSGSTRVLRRRRFLSAAGAGAAALAIACGQKSGPKPAGQAAQQASPGAPVLGGTYNFFQPTNPPTLDPQRTTSYFCMQPCSGPYSRIFALKVGTDPQISESAEPEPDLGLTAESPDGVTWTVKLRTDAKFHNVAPVNGRAVDATDIKLNYARALDAKNPNRGDIDMIDPNQIQTPAPDTVIFKLNYPYAGFSKILAAPKTAWILPREATSGGFDPAKVMIGSGPFTFDSYTPDVGLTFKKNPEWFLKGKPYLDGIRYSIIPDASQQYAQFSGGNLDEIDAIPGKDIDTLRKQNPKATFYTADSNQEHALIGQLGDPSSPWTDVRVRHAISMMIDRDAIGASVYSGHSAPTALVPPKFGKGALKTSDVAANVAQFYKYDQAAAKQMLAAAGVGGAPFAKLIYTANGYAQPYATLAETVNSMLNSAGVKTNLVNIDYNAEYVAGGKGVHYGNFNKDSLVFGLAGNGYVDVDQYLFAFYDSKSERRNTPINDPTFDAMMTKARSIINEDERNKAYVDIQKYLMDKVYFVAGWPEEPRYRLVQPWVQNYGFWANYSFMTDSYTKLWLKR